MDSRDWVPGEKSVKGKMVPNLLSTVVLNIKEHGQVSVAIEIEFWKEKYGGAIGRESKVVNIVFIFLFKK